MRVVQVHFGTDGGSERFFVNLVNELHRNGVEQAVLIRPRRAWRAAIDPGVEVHEGVFRRISLSRFFLAARFRRLLEAKRPDAIMAWMPRACRFMPAWPHCPRIARLGDYPPRLDYFTNIDRIICNTPGIVERLRGLGCDKPIDVISNFTTIKMAPPVSRASVTTPESAFVLLGVGRFVRIKGFHTMIEALPGLPGAMVWLLGDGEERANLCRQAEELGVLDRVRFLGWHKNPAAYMAACDVVCLPSTHETLGNVILEAWAVGKPVIASRSKGPSWFMKNERDGLLFDIEDVAGLQTAVTRLQSSPSLTQQIALGGAETLARQFSKDSVTSAFMKVLGQRCMAEPTVVRGQS